MTRRATGLCLALLLLFAAAAHAQKVTGVIKGKVTDPDGGVLPGATVILNSPKMIQKDLTTTTNHRGEYRFPLLDPGVYELRVEMMGFEPSSAADIRMLLGQTIDLAVVMQLEGVNVGITVQETPTVDTESTRLGTNFTTELLAKVPSARSLTSIINFTPGATDGTVHGSTVRGNALQLDGVDVTDPVVGTQMVDFNFDNLEEIQVETGGHKAEYGQVSGAIVNAVTKSGGNEFSGEANMYWQDDSMVSKNGQHLTERFESLTGDQLQKKIDTQAQLGGPISRDHVWFFASARYEDEDTLVVGFPTSTNTNEKNYFGKVTWQLTQSNKLVGSFNRSTLTRDGRGAGSLTPPESTRDQVGDDNTPNFEFTSTLTPTTTLQVRAGIVDSYFDLIPKNNEPGHLNLDTNVLETSDGRLDQTERDRRQVVASLSHYRDDWGGTHDFKFGFEYEDSDSLRDFSANQGLFYYNTNVDGISTPTYVYTVQDPPSKEALNRLSFYAQDSWTIADRLTLNLGVRVDQNKSSFPEQQAADGSTIGALDDVANFTDWSPRVGISYDITGDGRSVARFSYSRLIDANIVQYFNSINPNSISGQLRTVCSGPLGFLCVSGDSNYSSQVLDEFGASNTTIDDDFASPQIDEYSVGLEHELADDLAIAFNYIEKHERRLPEDVQQRTFFPLTFTDPGDTLVDWDDGSLLADIPGGDQLVVYDPDLTSPSQLLITNPDDAKREYRSLELVVNKRMSRRWQLLGSLVISRSAGLVGTSFGNSNAISGLYNDPNSLINAFGNLNFHRPYQLKLTGAYEAPYGVNLSWHYQWRSGLPYAREVRVTSAVNAAGQLVAMNSAVNIYAEKRGSRRLEALNELDFRVEKEFRLGPTRLDLILDAFNLFNIDTVTDVQRRSTSAFNFGDPLDFHTPRELRVAARMIW